MAYKKAQRGYESQMNYDAGVERHNTPYSVDANSGAINFDMLNDDAKRAILARRRDGGQIISKFKSAARFDQPNFKNGGRTTG